MMLAGEKVLLQEIETLKAMNQKLKDLNQKDLELLIEIANERDAAVDAIQKIKDVLNSYYCSVGSR